jgi:outer membrane protein TolC
MQARHGNRIARGGGLALALAISVGSGGVRAQSAPAQGGGRPPAPAALRLSMDDAVGMALDHNLDIAVDRLEPQVSDERVGQARSAFTPLFSAASNRNGQVATPSSFLVGTNGVRSDLFASTIGVSQRLKWGGGSYSVSMDGSRTSTASLFANFNPSLTARLQAVFSQPLLRDFRMDTARQQLIISKRNRDISDLRLRETVVRTVAAVKRAYWDLAAARAGIDVAQKSYDLALELARMNKARVDVGQSPELDLLQSQAEVAQREEALAVAQVTARQAEDRLRTQILDPDASSFWETELVLTDTPALGTAPPDLEAAVRAVLDTRLDLARARKDIENSETNVQYYASQRLPDFRIQGSFISQGLAGNQVIRTGGFPGTIVGSLPAPITDALNQVWNRAFPTWTLSVSFSYPLGRSYEEASLASARIQTVQARERLKSAEIRAVRQLRQAAWQIDMNRKRIETSRAARLLSERRLDSEQKRFEVGMSTSFLVVQAQRDLAQARNNELAAFLDYARSAVDFEALKETTLDQAGSTVTVTGSSVSAPAAASATTTAPGSTAARSGIM